MHLGAVRVGGDRGKPRHCGNIAQMLAVFAGIDGEILVEGQEFKWNPFLYQIALARFKITLVCEFRDWFKSLPAAFSVSGGKPVVFKTRCISVFVSPAAPLATICNTVETLKGEMKIFVPGCSPAICFSRSNAKPVLAEASFA